MSFLQKKNVLVQYSVEYTKVRLEGAKNNSGCTMKQSIMITVLLYSWVNEFPNLTTETDDQKWRICHNSFATHHLGQD